MVGLGPIWPEHLEDTKHNPGHHPERRAGLYGRNNGARQSYDGSMNM